jgi:hypothetical protein
MIALGRLKVSMNITDLVNAHLDVFYEIERRDATFRMDLDNAARRAINPWIMLGREQLGEEEMAIWLQLHRAELGNTEAIEKITDL